MELSQAEMSERMEHGAEWAFKKLDTTDEQEDLLIAELKGLTPTILKLQGEKLEMENKFRSALEQELVDREELDRLVQEVKEITDRSLDTGMEAFINIWETLTVEQREALLERWSDKG
jgi:Spy/CpxP family protein refolding chaperone